MKKQTVVAALLLSLIAIEGRTERIPDVKGGLHPADAYDITNAARSAAANEFIKTGNPRKIGSAYEVPITVAGKACTVLVKPYEPTSPHEPPVRWRAAVPECKE